MFKYLICVCIKESWVHVCVMILHVYLHLKVRIRCHLWHWLNLCKWNMQNPIIFISIFERRWILNIEHWWLTLHVNLAVLLVLNPLFVPSVGVKACIKAMKLVEEMRYEITADVHGIRDGPRNGRLRVLNKVCSCFYRCHLKHFGNRPFFSCFHGFIYNWKADHSLSMLASDL